MYVCRTIVILPKSCHPKHYQSCKILLCYYIHTQTYTIMYYISSFIVSLVNFTKIANIFMSLIVDSHNFSHQLHDECVALS